MAGREKIHNIFLDIIALLGGIVLRTLQATVYFFSGKQAKTGSRASIYKLIDFFVIKWPKSFYVSPSGYKLTRFIGDMIHYMFLKK